MSAGGLSYSGLVNHGKITLPSVDTWGTNMNILRDPPKSYHTRRIDKVGETSSITEMIDDSGNRACEAIQVYARGVNPFVSVSYGNEGNNGGQMSGGIVPAIQTNSAKLPYSVMKDGAFRPPVLMQEDLLPLSRMPRNWTSAFSQPGFADFSRKMRTCGTAEQTREVKNNTLKSFIRPTAKYQIETPISEPFEVKYMIQPTLKKSVTSGVRQMNITQQHAGNPTKEIYTAPLHAHVQANYVDNRKYVDNNKFDSSRYIQSTNPHAVVSNYADNRQYVDNNKLDSTRYIQPTNQHTVVSNISSNLHHTSIEDILDLSDLPVHTEIMNISAIAPLSAPEQTRYIHNDVELTRSLPSYQATSNIMDTRVHKNINHENTITLSRNIPNGNFTTNIASLGFSDNGSRDVRLHEKINPGGYSIPGQIPTTERSQYSQSSHESEKARMNRMVMESMQGRFDKPAPYGNTF